MEKRNWRGEAIDRARVEGEQLEQLMRSILKLFADGCLVYRRRERHGPSVETKSERLRRLRQRQIAVIEPGAALNADVA
ncbi:MAG: hypothetical protein KF878_19655 [Planctomycetes bacterium]|nr:hypothetical protein [Planctomycetota bacterium]